MSAEGVHRMSAEGVRRMSAEDIRAGDPVRVMA
jgi:hypothetical protein